ncbi:hypothetical protein D1BOALGB6SA_2523 [Olavius sp. associated proteobacterium Delta 1]|nr:hypothetical protein D1BOALGB6SA_2523 [Olavius sp. associated proteobacterium Delta 1]
MFRNSSYKQIFQTYLFKNKLLGNSAIYMAGNILSQAIAFFALPVFTRYLTKADYGILSYTGSVTSFLLVISTLSLHSFILKYYFERQTEKERKELFGTIFLFLMVFNLALLYIEFQVFPHLLKWFHIQIPFYPYFAIALVINFLQIAPIIPLTYFRVTKKAWGYFWLTSSQAILGILFGLILVIGSDMGVMGRFYGSLYSNIISLIVCIIIIIKVSRISFNFNTIKKSLKFSLPLLPGGFAGIAIASMDRIILERYVSLSQLGIYSVGVTLGTSLLIIVRSFYLAVEPEVYELYNQEGFDEKIVRLKNNLLYVILCIGCIIIIFSREIVSIVASERFYESYTIIPFFVTGTIFRGAEILVGITLFAMNKTIYQPIIVGVALLFNVVGNLIFIPLMGIMGAAFASTLAFMIMLMVSVYITSKFSEISWNCLRDTFLIVISCGISTLIMNIQIGILIVTVLVKAIFAVFIFFIALYFFRKNMIGLTSESPF